MRSAELKAAVSQFLPHWIRSAKRRMQAKAFSRKFKDAPLSDVFSTIYAENRWGGAPGEFCSGSGSEHQIDYAQFVSDFIVAHKIKTVVDVGCGDFQVGRLIVRPNLNYIGVDIAPALVERNEREFGTSQIEFRCLNAVDDELPDGDLLLIRQVLQHLSNAQISNILAKIGPYKSVLVSEEQPLSPKSFNLDKSAGLDTRVDDRSGVYLDKPPFRCRAEVVFRTPVANPRARTRSEIVTYSVR